MKFAYIICLILCLGCSSPLKPLPTDIPSLKVLAQQGDPWAQFNLGSKYALGQGVARDEKEAAKWFRMAAESNYPLAQHTLGVMYENGKGVKRDLNKAIKWYQMAADRGYNGSKAALKNLSEKQTPTITP